MVDDFGTNRKRLYDFLLVGHWDYGPILHRFWDIQSGPKKTVPQF